MLVAPENSHDHEAHEAYAALRPVCPPALIVPPMTTRVASPTMIAMQRVVVLVIVTSALAACSARQQRVANAIGLATSTTALGCDWAFTRSHAVDGWRRWREANPVLGDQPSARRVDLYFATTAALQAGAWRLLPPRWRIVVPAIVLAFSARPIARQMGLYGPEANMASYNNFCPVSDTLR